MSFALPRTLLGVVAIALSSGVAHADPAPARLHAMKLGEALAYARAHQPQVLAAEARIAAARADAEIPRAQWYPTIGAAAELVVGTTNNTTATPINPGVLDIARIGGTQVVRPGQATMKPAASTYLGVGVDQEVFDFGRIAAQSAAMDASVLVERQEGAATILDIEFAVESAYFAVNAAKAVVVAAEGAHARSAAHRDLAKAGVDSGLRPPLELTRAEADLKRFDVGRIRAAGGLAAARVQLAAAVGVPEAALDASDAGGGDAGALPSLTSLLRETGERDPRVLAAVARVREQEARTHAIRAEMRPNLALSGTFSGRGGGADGSTGPLPSNSWAPAVPNWDVGLVLSWRAFDETILSRASASRAREQVRRAELASVRQGETSFVLQAFTAADVARNALPALVRSREAADANYAQVDARFKAGLSTAVELADAEALRTDAEIQQALGAFEVARTRAALLRAVGKAHRE